MIQNKFGAVKVIELRARSQEDYHNEGEKTAEESVNQSQKYRPALEHMWDPNGVDQVP